MIALLLFASIAAANIVFTRPDNYTYAFVNGTLRTNTPWQPRSVGECNMPPFELECIKTSNEIAFNTPVGSVAAKMLPDFKLEFLDATKAPCKLIDATVVECDNGVFLYHPSLTNATHDNTFFFNASEMRDALVSMPGVRGPVNIVLDNTTMNQTDTVTANYTYYDRENVCLGFDNVDLSSVLSLDYCSGAVCDISVWAADKFSHWALQNNPNIKKVADGFELCINVRKLSDDLHAVVAKVQGNLAKRDNVTTYYVYNTFNVTCKQGSFQNGACYHAGPYMWFVLGGIVIVALMIYFASRQGVIQ